jgi:hypothetical protein
VLKLSSDSGTGKVRFDDQSLAELRDGQWTLDKISAGEHKLKVDGPQGGASFTFSSEAGGLPIVKGAIVSRGALALVISGNANRLHVYSSDSSTKISLDGQPSVNVPEDGLDFPSISAGVHEFAVSGGGEHSPYQYKLDVDSGAAPTLNAFLEYGQNVGTLVVVAGQDKAKVFLNGKLQPQLTENGQLLIPNLESKDYVVRVSKNGFQDAPEQKVRVRKNERGRLVFNLQPVPRFASLTIQGGIPGATVLIDQSPVGTVQPDGTLTVATVNPGDHIVELRKDRFKAKQIKRSFAAGATVSLAAADAALETAPGELRVAFTPADAQVTLAKAGETPIKVSNGTSLSLAPGSYTLTAKIADFTRSPTVEVTAGQSRTLDLSLGPSGMSKWDDSSSWKQEKGAYIHKGGDFVMYTVSPTSGTFLFSAMLAKGHRLQWVLNCIDANNYVLFQIDENNFYRTVVHNGQKGKETKIPHKGDKKSFQTLQIRVGANEITHQIRQGENWVVLDHWTQSGSNLSLGRFGFYIPGNDQVALANFGHYVDLNTR